MGSDKDYDELEEVNIQLNKEMNFRDLLGIGYENIKLKIFSKSLDSPVLVDSIYIIAKETYELIAKICEDINQVKIDISVKNNNLSLEEIMFPSEKLKSAKDKILGEDITNFLQTRKNRIDVKIDSETKKSIAKKIIIMNQGIDLLNSYCPDFLKESITTFAPDNKIELKDIRIPNIDEHILHYETKILPVIEVSAQALDSLYFDFLNLLNNDPINNNIADVIRKQPICFDKYQFLPVHTLLLTSKNQKVFMREKTNYLNFKKIERKENVYNPLALRLFASSLEQSGEIKQIIINEFNNYKDRNEIRRYVKDIKSRKTLLSVLPKIITRIKDQAGMNSSETYLNIISENKPIEKLITEEFVNLWINSYNNGWADQLANNLSIINDLDKQQFETLSRQEGGALYLLLKQPQFKTDFLKGNTKSNEYDKLYTLFELNPKIFEETYKIIDRKDNEFLTKLVKLVSYTNGAVLQITQETKKFILNLENYKNNDIEAIITLLANYDSAQKAINLRITPYNKQIDKLEDKIGFAHWYKDHKDRLNFLIETTQKAITYLGNSKSITLRETIVQIIDKHGEEFARKNLPQFEETGTATYQRIADLILRLDDPSRMIRKRELRDLIIYHASQPEEESWENIKTYTINCPDAERLSKHYDAITISEGMRKSKNINGNYTLTTVYKQLKITNNEYILDDLIDLHNQRKIKNNIFEKLIGLLSMKQIELSKYVITQIKNGMPNNEVSDFMELYTSDVIFRNNNPTLLFNDYHALKKEIPQKIETIEQKSQEFDYTHFESYVKQHNYNPAIVRIIIEKGFKLLGSGRFIGENYLRTQYLLKTGLSDDENKSETQNTFLSIIKWMIDENIIIHHTKKGTQIKSGCVSINPHLKELSSEPMRNYMAHVLYG